MNRPPVLSETNRLKLEQCESALRRLLGEVMERGFFGTASLEISVQDGTIQRLRRTVERIEK